MRERLPTISGYVRVGHVTPAGQFLPTGPWRPNLVLYEWGAIVGPLLARGDPAYKVGGMYLEYANVSDPSTPVAAPAYDRTGGIGYYAGLGLSSDLDYLRVPLLAATPGTSDPVLYPLGNLLTFFAQSQGTVGIHGKPFTAGTHSKLYGAALVAMPVLGDSSRDLVLSRIYFDAADQLVKLASGQLGVNWELELM